MKINKDKCRFRVSEGRYLGRVLNADGVKPDPLKVEAIKALPHPGDRKELQRFWCVVTYLSTFIPIMSQKSAPLRQLLQKYVAWSWGQAENEAFESLKTAISSTPFLLSSSTQKSQYLC